MLAGIRRDTLLANLEEDKHRTYSSVEVDPFEVKPLPDEMGAWAKANPRASLEGWEKILRLLATGVEPGPLMVERDGEGYALSGPSALGGDMPGSVALLYALRRAGKTSWPAVLATDSLEKADDTPDPADLQIDVPEIPEDIYQLNQEDSGKAQQALYLWAALVLATVKAALDAWLPELASAGADWGGGLEERDLNGAVTAATEEQLAYLGGFKEDMQARIDEFLGQTWTDEGAFDAGLGGILDWAQNRAESYAVGGGQEAWRTAAALAMVAAGTEGGYWLCTFGPGSCVDCKALHGQFLTVAQLRATWGKTQCNGACLCGFEPANGLSAIAEEALAAFDAGAGEGLES